MFCVIYEFEARSGCEEAFETSWYQITQSIYRIYGALGSRLHKQQNGKYFAYAQWPDEATWQKMREGDKSIHPAHARYEAARKSTKIIFKGTVVHDYLQSAVFAEK